MSCSKWRKLRAIVLSNHPICQECERRGIYRTATEVHHIKPIESANDTIQAEIMCYDPSNLLAVCRDCHIRLHKSLGKNTKASKLIRESILTQSIIDNMSKRQ
ncbi:MAG: HNH endonuclease signature motif containing protein [Alloprevotella sp.]